jgi:hypothetical protein
LKAVELAWICFIGNFHDNFADFIGVIDKEFDNFDNSANYFCHDFADEVSFSFFQASGGAIRTNSRFWQFTVGKITAGALIA